MSKKIYKVCIIVQNPSSYIDINNEIQGLLPSLWKSIKKKLGTKYNFKEIIINHTINWDEYLKKVTEGEYDIIIAGYWILPKRLKQGSFTKGIFLNAPVIIYENDIQDKMKIGRYIKYLLKIWYKPILLLILICFILSFFYYSKKNWDIKASSTIIFFGMLVNKNNFFNNNISIIEKIIILLLTYFLMLFILSYTLQKTINTEVNFKMIDNNISGMAFYVQRGSHSVNLLKSVGAIPIQVDEPYIQYSRHRFNKKVNGYVFDDIDIDKVLLHKDKQFSISEIIKKWFYVGFPVNSKNKDLLADIDKIIEKMKIEGEIYQQCQNIVGNNTVIFC